MRMRLAAVCLVVFLFRCEAANDDETVPETWSPYWLRTWVNETSDDPAMVAALSSAMEKQFTRKTYGIGALDDKQSFIGQIKTDKGYERITKMLNDIDTAGLQDADVQKIKKQFIEEFDKLREQVELVEKPCYEFARMVDEDSLVEETGGRIGIKLPKLAIMDMQVKLALYPPWLSEDKCIKLYYEFMETYTKSEFCTMEGCPNGVKLPQAGGKEGASVESLTDESEKVEKSLSDLKTSLQKMFFGPHQGFQGFKAIAVTAHYYSGYYGRSMAQAQDFAYDPPDGMEKSPPISDEAYHKDKRNPYYMLRVALQALHKYYEVHEKEKFGGDELFFPVRHPGEKTQLDGKGTWHGDGKGTWLPDTVDLGEKTLKYTWADLPHDLDRQLNLYSEDGQSVGTLIISFEDYKFTAVKTVKMGEHGIAKPDADAPEAGKDGEEPSQSVFSPMPYVAVIAIVLAGIYLGMFFTRGQQEHVAREDLRIEMAPKNSFTTA